MNKALKECLKWRSPKRVDQIFDLLIFNAFICGQTNMMVPVDESREVFEHVKKLLTNNYK